MIEAGCRVLAAYERAEWRTQWSEGDEEMVAEIYRAMENAYDPDQQSGG